MVLAERENLISRLIATLLLFLAFSCFSAVAGNSVVEGAYSQSTQ